MSIEAMKQARDLLLAYQNMGDFRVANNCLSTVHALTKVIEEAEKQEVEHYSDCAVHNEPAYPKGECDCKTILPKLIATVPDNMQDWAELDGTTAWHLMERHADNWADIGKMMDEFVAAKLAKHTQSEKESTLQEISDIGQEIEQTHTDHPARHWDRTCPACVAEAEKQEPVAYPGDDIVGACVCGSWPGGKCLKCPRITHAPPGRGWVGLTDEDKKRHDLDRVPDWVLIIVEEILRTKNT